MKKIMIMLLMVAVTLNVMAVTYSAKAKLTLTSTSNNKSCTLTIAESEDLNAGLNNGYYAELNTEGKEVWFYVVYNDVKYQQFASNQATMQGLQLGIKTNASETYTLTASNVVGTPHIMINGVDYPITAGMSESITLAANSTLPAPGDEDKYAIQPLPPTPLVKNICFNYNILTLTVYDGAKVEVFAPDAATATVSEIVSGDAPYDIDLNVIPDGRYIIRIDLDGDNTVDEEYIIDVNPDVIIL